MAESFFSAETLSALMEMGLACWYEGVVAERRAMEEAWWEKRRGED